MATESRPGHEEWIGAPDVRSGEAHDDSHERPLEEPRLTSLGRRQNLLSLLGAALAAAAALALLYWIL